MDKNKDKYEVTDVKPGTVSAQGFAMIVGAEAEKVYTVTNTETGGSVTVTAHTESSAIEKAADS